MEHRIASPPLHYIRVFEGRIWAAYLDRAPEFSRSQRMLVYQWRGEKVNEHSPLRVFLEFRKQAALLPWPNLLAPVVIWFFVLLLLYLGLENRSTLSSLYEMAKSNAVLWIAGIALIPMIGLINAASRKVQSLKATLQKLEVQYRKIEKWIFKTLAK